MSTHTLVTTLRLDAAANAAAGLGLALAGGWLAPHLGIPAGWPLRVAGVVLLVYAYENAIVARRPTRSGLLGLVAVDVGFAVAVLGAALGDPTGAATPARWGLAAIALASLGFGAAKQLARRHLGGLPAAVQPVSSTSSASDSSTPSGSGSST